MDLTAKCQGLCRPDRFGGPRTAMPGMALCDVCEERVPEDLTHVAEHWAALEAQLTSANHGPTSARRTRDDSTGIALNAVVVDVRANIDATVTLWAHLIHERRREPIPPGTPARALWVAHHHRTITRGTDHGLAWSLAVDAHDIARLLRRRAYPTGDHWHDTGIPCTEHVETDDGMVPCGGVYRAWITTRDIGTPLPDLECSVDRDHIQPPHKWRHLARKLKHRAHREHA